MNTFGRLGTSAALATSALAISLMSGCGSKSTPSTNSTADTTSAAARDTSNSKVAGAKTTASGKAVASAAPATEVQVLTPPSDPSQTTAPSASTLAPATGREFVTAQLAALGVGDKAKIDCVTSAAGDSAKQTEGMNVAMAKALLICVPDAMATVAAPEVKSLAPGVTDDQAKCVATALYTVLGKLNDTQFKNAYVTGSIHGAPDYVKTPAKAAASSCGVSTADLAKIFRTNP